MTELTADTPNKIIENEKENSFEDLLGEQSLLVSDDEDEDNASANVMNSRNLVNVSAIVKKSTDKKLEKLQNASDKVSPAINENTSSISLETNSTNEKPISNIVGDNNIVAAMQIKFSKNIEKIGQLTDDDEATDDINENADGMLKKPKQYIQKISRLIDSDSENEQITKIDNIVVNENANEMKVNTLKSKKYSRLIDSDSEDELQQNTENIIDSHKPEQENEKPKKKKISKLIDSESEEEKSTNDNGFESDENAIEFKEKKITKLVGSDSEDGMLNNSKQNSDEENKKKQKKPKKQLKSKIIDSESDQDSDNLSNDDHDSDKEDENSKKNKSEKKPKAMRASAKKALDEMQALQSEQQRLHREAYVNIPYHRPKKHTLQEFLKRRTLNKPGEQDNGGVMKPKSLKMSAEELIAYAKLMDERAKEATEFFRSESEEDNDFHDNAGIIDDIEESNHETEKDINLVQCIQNAAEATETIIANTALKTEDIKSNESITNLESMNKPMDIVDNVTDNTLSNQMDIDNIPTTSKVIINEVLILPNINLDNLNITPDRKERKKNENIKRLLAEKQLKESPTLKGQPDMLIDLDTGDLVAKQPTPIDNLLERLLKTNKLAKAKTTQSVDILSTENGIVEFSKIQLQHNDEADLNKEPKPGAAYFKLKQNLKTIIAKKRLEDIKKRHEQESEHNKCLDGDYDDEEEEFDDDEMEYEPDNKPQKKDLENEEDENVDENYEVDEDDIDLIENEADVSDEDSKSNDVDDDNDVENYDDDYNDNNQGKEIFEDDENDSSENADKDDDDTTEELHDVVKRKNRIIKAFENDTDDEHDDDDADFLKTQNLSTKLSICDASMLTPFNEPTQKTLSQTENELLDLCSGSFEKTQNPGTTSIISQIPKTQMQTETENAEELLGLCSGSFGNDNYIENNDENKGKNHEFEVTQTQTIPILKRIISSDEDEDLTATEDDKMKEYIVERKKKLTKKLKKRKVKLGFSDDEEEDDERKPIYETDEESNDEEHLENDEEEPEIFIDYDSEENEVEVKMTKKDCKKKAEIFLEKEADLSESDWGSADEDEKNMDDYDFELGDEENFDREKLRNEIGKIHARKMLDEDIKEVRKLQEMFFEDEEKDGVGRQRQFRWKNAEAGFSLDDMKNDENDGDKADSGDEENEATWRKIRYEREKILKEQAININSPSSNTTMLNNTTTITTTTGSVKKINLLTGTKKSNEIKQSSPFLISRGTTAGIQNKIIRGSFLVRDPESLTKLVGITKSGSGDISEAAGTVNINKSIKPKNFVFATLTEEEHENLKRKADDLINSSSENGINYMKKPKYEPRRERCLIDQLL